VFIGCTGDYVNDPIAREIRKDYVRVAGMLSPSDTRMTRVSLPALDAL